MATNTDKVLGQKSDENKSTYDKASWHTLFSYQM